MTKKMFGGNEAKIVEYVESVFMPEDQILRDVRLGAEHHDIPAIQVGKFDGLHLEILTRMANAKKAVEIGTFGGYSGICIARGLGSGGRLYTFELEPDRAKYAALAFKKAGVDKQVEILVGPALDNLPKINQHGPFDLVFIDADKVNYPAYLAWALENLRVGGVVLGDNTFAWGMIANNNFDNPDDEASALALRKFNLATAQSGRFRATILPTGEGLTVAVKIF